MSKRLLKDAKTCWEAAFVAVDPAVALKKAARCDDNILQVGDVVWDIEGGGRVAVAAFGKASISMAGAFLEIAGSAVDQCLVIHPSNAHWQNPPGYVETIAAGHPIPDMGSLQAGRRLAETADGLGENDLLVLLISGGGSALACAPAEGISFEDKAATNEALLRSGADIHAVNCVRKHLSAIKGGRLAARAAPAHVVALTISDVIGDDPSVIASGPAAPDDSTYEEAFAICKKASVPRNVIELLDHGARGLLPETSKPGAPIFKRVRNFIIASNRAAIDAATSEAGRLGYKTMALTDKLAGEAREVGKRLASLIKSSKPGVFIVAGGETTVTVTGNGKGGRCQELALAAAMELDGAKDTLIWAAGTDGIDGPTDAAGAWADGISIIKSKAAGLAPVEYLMNNDAYHFFENIDGLIKTGPTGVNVMDLIFLIKH